MRLCAPRWTGAAVLKELGDGAAEGPHCLLWEAPTDDDFSLCGVRHVQGDAQNLVVVLPARRDLAVQLICLAADFADAERLQVPEAGDATQKPNGLLPNLHPGGPKLNGLPPLSGE